MICARCGNEFLPDRSYQRLCPDCYNEVGLIGDTSSAKMWGAVSVLVNESLSMYDLKELADSVAFMRLVEEVINEMDITMRGRWLTQEEKKYLELTQG